MPTQTLAKLKVSKVLDNGTFLHATACLNHHEGNAAPHFSLTGELWESWNHYNRRGPRETGLLNAGAIGDLIAENFPELAIVNALHLSDDHGAPIYAIENGYYFYSGEAHAYECDSRYSPDPTDTRHERAAHYLRVTPEALPKGLDRDGFTAYVETLRPQWEAEAAQALAALNA